MGGYKFSFKFSSEKTNYKTQQKEKIACYPEMGNCNNHGETIL